MPTARITPALHPTLAQVKRFAQMYGVHVWFVAHPRQLQNWHGEPPTLYDISGSANFINKVGVGCVEDRAPHFPTLLLPHTHNAFSHISSFPPLLSRLTTASWFTECGTWTRRSCTAATGAEQE